jgi:predicted nucleotidyltransferase/DNA-binding HxlR family transcriptional regulator
MRFHEPLDDILGSIIKVKILRVLNRTHGQFTGREISRLVGYSPTHTISTLRDLESEGLVWSQRAGKADLFSLNERSPAVQAVLDPMFEWEQGLFSDLAGMFEAALGDKLLEVRLFGSVARGEEHSDSDVDLLLVVRDDSDIESTEKEVASAAIEAGNRFGTQLVPFVVTASDYDKKVRSKRGFWKDIKDKSIAIYYER